MGKTTFVINHAAYGGRCYILTVHNRIRATMPGRWVEVI